MAKKIKTKAELLAEIKLRRKLLDKKLTKLTPEQTVWAGSMNEWSVKDILGHLIDWEKRFMRWYKTGKQGKNPKVPDPKFKWPQLNELNDASFAARQEQPLAKILKESAASYKKILALIEGMDEAEIFTRKVYPWTDGDALLDWILANTADHYNWARLNIRITVIQKADGTYVEKPRKQKPEVEESENQD